LNTPKDREKAVLSTKDRDLIEPDQLFSPFDRAFGAILDRLVGRYRLVTLSVTVVLYAGAMLIFGRSLGVSSNYFVLLPVIGSAIAYGFYGGVIAGILGLPANLLFFTILGHPDYSPASKLMAELSGILVGSVLGYLSDYQKKLDAERCLRKDMEDELRRALRDRETLFREVHHRVKNNLNLIKSIIALQTRRSKNQEFKDAAATLTGRIMSISFVHERLYRTAELSTVSLDEYLRDIIGAVAMATRDSSMAPLVSLDLVDRSVSMDVAVPLGLIANELMTNSLKHCGFRGIPIHIEVSLVDADDRLTLTLRDDGDGLPGMEEGKSMQVEDTALSYAGSLGLTLLDLMISQLGGEGCFLRHDGWTEFSCSFPAPKDY
jgi:two-component sensor histidine kinase